MATKSEALKARQTAAVPRGIATKSVYAAKAENAEVWDVDGKRYIDFAAGIAVVNTGHRHPKVMAAVAKQTRRLHPHLLSTSRPTRNTSRSPSASTRRRRATSPRRHMFVTTGAEAVENAVKSRARRDGPHGDRLLHRRLPWPHHDGHGADG